MFALLRVKFGVLVSKVYRLFNRVDDTPETIIHNICDEIEGKIVSLVHAVQALDTRHEENEALIRSIEVENDEINVQARRAYKLQQGLDKLLNGE